jgi:hypothetical protein
MAIKAEFQRINNVVIMTILEQGTEIERFGDCIPFYCDETNKIYLYASFSPEMYEHEEKYGYINLFLLGEDTQYDCNSACMQCESALEAQEIINRCINTIENYNKIAKGELPQETDRTPDIHIVG